MLERAMLLQAVVSPLSVGVGAAPPSMTRLAAASVAFPAADDAEKRCYHENTGLFREPSLGVEMGLPSGHRSDRTVAMPCGEGSVWRWDWGPFHETCYMQRLGVGVDGRQC